MEGLGKLVTQDEITLEVYNCYLEYLGDLALDVGLLKKITSNKGLSLKTRELAKECMVATYKTYYQIRTDIEEMDYEKGFVEI